MRYFSTLIILIAALSCNEPTDEKPKTTLFELLSSTQTGIKVKKDVEDTKEGNFLVYESFYNGGGVALGDINNDGLLDI